MSIFPVMKNKAEKILIGKLRSVMPARDTLAAIRDYYEEIFGEGAAKIIFDEGVQECAKIAIEFRGNPIKTPIIVEINKALAVSGLMSRFSILATRAAHRTSFVPPHEDRAHAFMVEFIMLIVDAIYTEHLPVIFGAPGIVNFVSLDRKCEDLRNFLKELVSSKEGSIFIKSTLGL